MLCGNKKRKTREGRFRKYNEISSSADSIAWAACIHTVPEFIYTALPFFFNAHFLCADVLVALDRKAFVMSHQVEISTPKNCSRNQISHQTSITAAPTIEVSNLKAEQNTGKEQKLIFLR